VSCKRALTEHFPLTDRLQTSSKPKIVSGQTMTSSDTHTHTHIISDVWSPSSPRAECVHHSPWRETHETERPSCKDFTHFIELLLWTNAIAASQMVWAQTQKLVFYS